MHFRDQIQKIESEKEKLEFLKGLPWQPVVSQSQGQFTVRIKNLGLIETEKDLNSAWANLEKRKTELFQKSIEAGVADELMFPDTPKPRGFIPSLEKTLLRHATIAAIYLTFALVAIALLSFKIQKGLERIGSETNKFVHPTKQEREKHIEDFKSFMEELKPFLREWKRDLDKDH